MSVSRLDKVYRSVLLSKFFTKGWGNPNHILRLFEFRKLLAERDKCYKLVPSNYPVVILNERQNLDYRIIEGKFRSPLAEYLPDVVSHEIVDAYFQLIVPLEWDRSCSKPVCIHFAGTGDHYFWRRRNVMAKPLLKAGIGAILLENPYYGLRKPKAQVRSSLHNVSDIFVMGGCLILECLVLLHWCERMGFGPLGVSGLSMGGHMASLAATSWPKPLVLVPCLSWSTASSVFTEGVMSDAIDWDLLQRQYLSDRKYFDCLSKLCTIVDDPFVDNNELGQKFSVNTKKAITPYEILEMLNRDCDSTGSQNETAIAGGMKNLLRRPPGLFTIRGSSRSPVKKRSREAIWFMRGMMDECTHLKNFPIPFDTSLVIAICAISDGYVPRAGCLALQELWPGATIRYLECGHVGAYIWYRKTFINAIIEGFDLAKIKLNSTHTSCSV